MIEVILTTLGHLFIYLFILSWLLLHYIWHLLIMVVQSTGVKNIPENLWLGELWHTSGVLLPSGF